MILFTAAILQSKEIDCTGCHNGYQYAGHKNIECTSCHPKTKNHFSKGDIFSEGAKGCITCHSDYIKMLDSKMHTRITEKQYVKDRYEKYDATFYSKNCQGCHILSCSDCHKPYKEHIISKNISVEKCINCHRDYYTGIEYIGLARKDDNEKFDVGVEKLGHFYQKMLPDVHFEKKLTCGICHTMKSLSNGKEYIKNCYNCHKKISKIPEHIIKQHIEKLSCNGCHSAWSQNEFGTYFMKITDKNIQKDYQSLKNISDDYKKTSYMKNNFETFLGINNSGKYTTIRPYFISFFVTIGNRIDNNFISADWKTTFSHTIRRETVLCQNCHENRKKYLLMKSSENIFDLKKDGIPLDSFYNSKGQNAINGKFVSETDWKRINGNSKEYQKYFILKQLELIEVIKDAR